MHLYDFNRVVKEEQALGIINEETHTGQGDLMSTGNNPAKYLGNNEVDNSNNINIKDNDSNYETK